MLCFMVLSCAFGYSQHNKVATQHPIDIWFEKNIGKDMSTAGMRLTTNQTQKMWDAEMNKLYSRLMVRLNSKQKSALRESQRNWLKFRDAKFKEIYEIIFAQEGTMWHLVADGERMETVRTRALELLAYEKLLDE
jgi:uncharacterized protein YecT (DUF1311 family)